MSTLFLNCFKQDSQLLKLFDKQNLRLCIVNFTLLHQSLLGTDIAPSLKLLNVKIALGNFKLSRNRDGNLIELLMINRYAIQPSSTMRR